MNEPVWISRRALEVLHDESIAQHGGAEGVRDFASLDSALSRAQGLFVHKNVSDLYRLAACYAAGIAENRPFVDGNKRAAFMAAGLFLVLNRTRLKADKVDAVIAMYDLAAGKITELQLADWLRRHS